MGILASWGRKKHAITIEIRLSYQNDIPTVLVHIFLVVHEAGLRLGFAKFRESACNYSLDYRSWSYAPSLEPDPLGRACIGRTSLYPVCCPYASRVA
jgi:hypothetical protein